MYRSKIHPKRTAGFANSYHSILVAQIAGEKRTSSICQQIALKRQSWVITAWGYSRLQFSSMNSGVHGLVGGIGDQGKRCLINSFAKLG
jgi:hypothetical protein